MFNIILNAVVGSRAYGLDTATSDTDTLGVFVRPTVEVAGLYYSPSSSTITDASPVGDDRTLHEVGKFLRLLINTNPNVLEVLYAEEFTVLSSFGIRILDLKDHILYTDRVRSAYRGFSLEQMHRSRAASSPHREYKSLRTALRIARQGVQLLQTGSMSLRVPDPQEYFDLEFADRDYAATLVSEEIKNLMETDSVLPDRQDIEPVADLLADIRRTHIG